MLIGAHEQVLTTTLILLIFFSLGLGALLIAIGVAVVIGRNRLLKGSAAQGNFRKVWIPRISIASAVFISMLGFYFVGESVLKDPLSLAQMSERLQDWWRQ